MQIFLITITHLTGQGVSYFKRGDITIGVIGLTTQFIPNWEQPAHIKGLTFNSAVETLKCILPDVRKNQMLSLCLIMAVLKEVLILIYLLKN